MVNHKNPDDLIIQIHPGPREAAVPSISAPGSGRLTGATMLAWNRRERSRSSHHLLCCQWAGLLSSLPSCPPFLKRPLPPWGSPLALAARQPFSAPQYLSRPLCESGSLEQAPAFVPTPWDPWVLTCGPTTLVICFFFSLGLQDSPMSHNLSVLYSVWGGGPAISCASFILKAGLYSKKAIPLLSEPLQETMYIVKPTPQGCLLCFWRLW